MKTLKILTDAFDGLGRFAWHNPILFALCAIWGYILLACVTAVVWYFTWEAR